MKRQIRNNIFETNSSSVHAITVSKFKPDKIYTGYNCEFKVGEFGWEHRTYYDYLDKMSYLWTAIIHNFLKFTEENNLVLDINNPDYIKIKEAIRTALVNIGFDNDQFSISFQENFEKDKYGYTEYGYIDHYPDISFVNALVFNEDRLIRFLFNEDSRITTWNDNDWFISEEKQKEFNKTHDYNKLGSDVYWDEHDWAYFDIPKDTEWKFLKDN